MHFLPDSSHSGFALLLTASLIVSYHFYLLTCRWVALTDSKRNWLRLDRPWTGTRIQGLGTSRSCWQTVSIYLYVLTWMRSWFNNFMVQYDDSEMVKCLAWLMNERTTVAGSPYVRLPSGELGIPFSEFAWDRVDLITSSCPFFQGQSRLSYSGRSLTEQMGSLSLEERYFVSLNVVQPSSRIHFVLFSRNLSGIRQVFLIEYTFCVWKSRVWLFNQAHWEVRFCGSVCCHNRWFSGSRLFWLFNESLLSKRQTKIGPLYCLRWFHRNYCLKT